MNILVMDNLLSFLPTAVMMLMILKNCIERTSPTCGSHARLRRLSIPSIEHDYTHTTGGVVTLGKLRINSSCLPFRLWTALKVKHCTVNQSGEVCTSDGNYQSWRI